MYVTSHEMCATAEIWEACWHVSRPEHHASSRAISRVTEVWIWAIEFNVKLSVTSQHHMSSHDVRIVCPWPYRPVLLLTAFAKLFEILVFHRVSQHFQFHNILILKNLDLEKDFVSTVDLHTSLQTVFFKHGTIKQTLAEFFVIYLKHLTLWIIKFYFRNLNFWYTI